MLLHTSALVAALERVESDQLVWLGSTWGLNAGAQREGEGGSRRPPRHWVLAAIQAMLIYFREVSHVDIFSRS